MLLIYHLTIKDLVAQTENAPHWTVKIIFTMITCEHDGERDGMRHVHLLGE